MLNQRFIGEYSTAGVANGGNCRGSRRVARACFAALAAAALAGAAGCSNSPSQSAATAAAKASRRAARLVSSAGSFVPVGKQFPGQYSEYVNPITQKSLLLQRGAHIRAEARRRQASNFVQRRTTGKALAEARSTVQQALAKPGLGNRFRAVLERQRGQICLAQAQHELDELGSALLQAQMQAQQVRSLVGKIGALTRSRMRLKQREQAGIATLRHLVAARKAKLAPLQKQLATANANYKALRTRYNSDTKKATALQRQGFKMQSQAELLRGVKGLQLYDKAMRVLKQAAGVAAKAAALSQRVYLAKEHQTAASLRAQRQQASLEAVQKALAFAVASAKHDQKEAKQLEQRARRTFLAAERKAARANALPMPPGSVATAIEQLNTTLAAVQVEYKVAERRANAAASSFQTALAAQQMAINDLQHLQTIGYHRTDPLLVGAENRSPLAYIQYYSAVAAYSLAQAHLAAMEAAVLQHQVQQVLQQAYRDVPGAQKVALQPLPKGSSQAQQLGAAVAALKEAQAKLVAAKGSVPAGRTPLKALVPAMSAVVYRQLATLLPAQAAQYNGLAVQQAEAALKLNGNAPVQWIVAK